MPRQPTQGQILAEYNALVPQAQSLGIRARTRAEWRGGRAAIQARLNELRNSIAQYNIPVSISSSLRTFGVEFEFYMPSGLSRFQLATLLTNAGIDTREEGYNHRSRTWWKIVTDASLGYSRGAELVSPVLQGEEGLEQVRKQLRQLIAAGCRVNSKCGYHVHVGIQNENVNFFKNIVLAYAKYEPVIDFLMSPSRRQNQYCNSLSNTLRYNGDRVRNAQTIEDLRPIFGLNKQFAKLNLFTYWRQGTVEFRQHQGTLDPLKADMWIRFVIRMVEAASKKSSGEFLNQEASLDKLLELVEAEASEKEYFTRRYTHFVGGGMD